MESLFFFLKDTFQIIPIGEFSGVPVGEKVLSLFGLCITEGVKLLMEATSDREIPEFRRIFKSVIDPYLEEEKKIIEIALFLRIITSNYNLYHCFLIHTWNDLNLG